MRFISRQIVFREIPEEISLSYLISGCGKRCPGCHSSDSWNVARGTKLSLQQLAHDIQRYSRRITCVLFMGGEWHKQELTRCLHLARERGLKTALYTGEDDVTPDVRSQLDYLKTGRYIRELGGLTYPATNQRLIHIPSGRCLNFYFHNHDDNRSLHHDSTESRPADRKTEIFAPLLHGSKCRRGLGL